MNEKSNDANKLMITMIMIMPIKVTEIVAIIIVIRKLITTIILRQSSREVQK